MSKDDGAENSAREGDRGRVNGVAPSKPRYIHKIDRIDKIGHRMLRFVSVGYGSPLVVTEMPKFSPHVKPSYTSRAPTVLVSKDKPL